ncbi:bacterioferritin-associated ferredoxin [Clostridium tetanomorphum]|uniref:(2Fe-2S)-binding protein n=1 Tax=Clostridium tetanomorphum TaxID=1553 RepID=A0A923EEZ2_CLOTT|nr:(2Fe-2S)-binding protein [Clostridium tetanomorphum]KAJ50049.1 BFD/(2Fe-2S)-binding domain-containing protein [Clostridium tetanomorphum DSM 665]MBC2399978.1 (2Fe-2S)-binding protein [Clostridium tetanomorphum]MBP1865822.1 bacterioferritin-associated ferredoxin [Clostridium tetanomorphum]NRS85271.1 bacterioferritin-associated ferredoxin [Clostridium tetanomorphum]NRZ98448.1 bacterioferritin-associated ferredoxin [Clostridium tetanomorphum]
MEQNLNNDILDKLTKVCICKAISRSKIKHAIKGGARTLEEVNNITGAGSGGCGGKGCRCKIEDILKQLTTKE